MAIDNTTVVPKLVAAALLRQFYNDRVYSARVNNTWRNMLNPYGDSIIINRPEEVTIGDYNKTDISYGAADVGSPLTLTMDKVKYWSVQFDDLDRAVSRIDLLQESVREFGTKLAETVDADVRDKMITTTGGALDIGTAIADDSNVWKTTGIDFGNQATLDGFGTEDLQLDVIHRIMDVNNIPIRGRWAIVNPYFAQVVRRIALKSDRILTNPNTPAGRIASNGLMGEFAGFNWYVDSGNYAEITYSGAANARKASAFQKLLFGVDSAVAFIDQIRKTERLRLEKRFSDAVRGLYKYGAQNVYERRIFMAPFTADNLDVGTDVQNLVRGPLQSTGLPPVAS